jgi:hypothetical protein
MISNKDSKIVLFYILVGPFWFMYFVSPFLMNLRVILGWQPWLFINLSSIQISCRHIFFYIIWCFFMVLFISFLCFYCTFCLLFFVFVHCIVKLLYFFKLVLFFLCLHMNIVLLFISYPFYFYNLCFFLHTILAPFSFCCDGKGNKPYKNKANTNYGIWCYKHPMNIV